MAEKQDKAGENAGLKAEAPNHRIKTIWEPAGVKAGDQAEAPAGVMAKAEVQDRVTAGGLDTLTIHSDCVTIGFLTQLGQSDIAHYHYSNNFIQDCRFAPLVGRAGGQIGRVRARIANPATQGKTESE